MSRQRLNGEPETQFHRESYERGKEAGLQQGITAVTDEIMKIMNSGGDKYIRSYSEVKAQEIVDELRSLYRSASPPKATLEDLVAYKIKNMTLRELAAYKASDDYCWLALDYHDFDLTKCKREHKILTTRLKKEQAEQWQACLSAAEGDRAKAETAMVNLSIPPPHWNTLVECGSCGPVFWLPEHRSQTVTSCPWCEHTRETQILLNQLEN